MFQNLSNQLDDSDIPTSEAELMPQYGTKISKRMRTRRTRLLKALHRLLYVENMNLSPEEMAKRLCAIELESKGLYLTDGDAVRFSRGMLYRIILSSYFIIECKIGARTTTTSRQG